MPRPATLTPELLDTFVTLVRARGDASAAGTEMGINQPSMSKRLAYFQHVGKLLRRPWLERRGKTWVMTDEGQRVLPVVEDLLNRYEHMLEFVEGAAPPGMTFACGREAAETFVLDAMKKFRTHHKEAVYQVMVLRGQARVEGVSSGRLSMALVSYDDSQIAHHARGKPLHVEELRDDPLVLACGKKTEWTTEFEALADGKITAKALARFPLILPEGNASVREHLVDRVRKEGGEARLNVALEVGGWATIRRYSEAGLGVGLLPRSVMEKSGSLLVRKAGRDVLPRNTTRLICRKKPGGSELDLSPDELAFLELLRDAAK